MLRLGISSSDRAQETLKKVMYHEVLDKDVRRSLLAVPDGV
jgi:hypothetical protein